MIDLWHGDYALAGKDLKTLFLSEIVGLIATVLSGVALVGQPQGTGGSDPGTCGPSHRVPHPSLF